MPHATKLGDPCPLCEAGRLAPAPGIAIKLVEGCHCGPWEVADPDIILGAVQQRSDRWLLSAWLRNRYVRSGAPYRYADRTDGKLPDSIREPRVQEKIDAAVLHLADRSDGLGSPITLDLADLAPVLWTRPQREVATLLFHLRDAGLILLSRPSEQKGTPYHATLTVPGWARVDQLRPLGARGLQVFVAMAFGEGFQTIYDQAIAPPIAACGYEPFLVARDQFEDKIDDKIMAEIRRCRLLVAEMTGHRQNVYFEAGFAFGLGVPVVLLCREEEIDKLHFDVRQYPCLGWKSHEELRRKLEDRIRALYPQVRAGL